MTRDISKMSGLAHVLLLLNARQLYCQIVVLCTTNLHMALYITGIIRNMQPYWFKKCKQVSENLMHIWTNPVMFSENPDILKANIVFFGNIKPY